MKVLIDTRWWITLGAICLSLSLWLATGLSATGEPSAPLSIAYRVALLGIVFVAIAGYSFSIHLKSLRTNANLLRDISRGGPSDTTTDRNVCNAEERQLWATFSDAVALLKKRRFGRFGSRRQIFQLPWYIVLGSPGSGKATAIRHSGLHFSLDGITPGNSLGGVGGTRNCDWWITEQAVLLSTDRYVGQSSASNGDTQGWKTFLQALRTNRSRQPINGVILVISVDELLQHTDDDRRQYAHALTAGFLELATELHINFPVYVLVTRVDLLSGCREFFDALDIDEQDQVWGTTLAPDAPVNTLVSALKFLSSRLHQQLPIKLHSTSDTKRRQAIYGFPGQMENLLAMLQGLVTDVLSQETIKDMTQLRGVYFTSTAQEASPIEQLSSVASISVGINGSSSTKLESSRSLFIKKLFPQTIFPEAFLVRTNFSLARRMHNWRLVAMVCIGVVAIGFTSIWTGAFAVHQNLASKVKEDLSKFEQSRQGTDQLLAKNLQSVQHLQSAAAVIDKNEYPWLTSLRGYDVAIDAAAKRSYIRAIKFGLVPALGGELSAWLTAYRGTDYQEHFDALKAYLMLSNHTRRDDTWFLSWLARSPIPMTQLDAQGQLTRHMQALFKSDPEYRLSPIDDATVQHTRDLLSQVKPATAVYGRMKSIYASQSTNLLPKMGPYFTSVLQTQNETTLQVPSLYMVSGYQRADFGVHSESVSGWLNDRWVLGEEDILGSMELAGIADEVKQLYSADYIATWQSLLGNIDLIVPTDTGRLSETLGYLSDFKRSPLSALLTVLAKETNLPSDSEAHHEAGEAALDAAPYSNSKSDMGPAEIARSGESPGGFNVPDAVSRAFSPYHNMLRGKAGSKNVQLAKKMDDLQQWLNLTQQSPNTSSANSPSRELIVFSRELPVPFSQWAASLADSAQATAKNQRVGQLDSKWQSAVAQACTQSFNGRFPFTSTADADSSLNDFENFFAPGGIEDRFVQQYLNPLIREKDISLSSSAAWSLRQTERIREAFFAKRNTLGFTYQLTSVDVDDRIEELVIESGDTQRVDFKHGSTVPLQLNWPDGEKGMVINFINKDGTVGRQSIDGSWAIFRAVSFSRSDAKNHQAPLVMFSNGDIKATFSISSDSKINPFLPGLLDKYQCRSNL